MSLRTISFLLSVFSIVSRIAFLQASRTNIMQHISSFNKLTFVDGFTIQKGILKLKNSQVEAALGDYGVVHPRSTRVRLVIMAILMDENHKEIILQNVSDPIACNQISSEPVILKTSIDRDYAIGGSELWIIGKSLFTSGLFPVALNF